MADYLSKLMETAGTFGRGILLEIIPKIAGGFINELFHQWEVDVPKVTQDVLGDKPLWENMEPSQREQLEDLKQRVGNLDFLTPELVVDSIKVDFPAVASLFLNWPEAGEWLDKQINNLKAGLNGVEL